MLVGVREQVRSSRRAGEMSPVSSRKPDLRVTGRQEPQAPCCSRETLLIRLAGAWQLLDDNFS